MPELRRGGPKTSELDGQTARNNHSRGKKTVGNDLVVFELFFFFFPSYTWQGRCAALAARKC
jgi:hypothetical protein